ncbi:MAG: M18 family aminopeptidase [Clostridia bacterium]|nr:M18 family aminopeptidase [Clostridia bacterium]
MKKDLISFLKNSLTTYHARENEKEILTENGFLPLLETEDWTIEEGGKYFVARGGALIAFTVGSLDEFSYKIAAAHNDSPALKIKENPVVTVEKYAKLNVEKYGGGIWYSFLDRPLKIAGQVVRKVGGALKAEAVEAPFLVTIPSVAIHQNREVNDKFAINVQTDMQPLCSLVGEDFSSEALLEKMVGENAVSYDLYLVNADMPYTFGANDEFLASPRIDDLASAYALLQALLAHGESEGICVAAFLNREEVGSLSADGADGDFLENTLRRIAYALRFDDNEYYKALAASFLLSSDNAHAAHPNHPEKCDPTNRARLGGGVVIKSQAGGAYITDAMSSAVVKTLLDNANVPYQAFANRADMPGGSTLAPISIRHVGIAGADIGIAQLAMHSSCECIALADYEALETGVKAYYSSSIRFCEDGVYVE